MAPMKRIINAVGFACDLAPGVCLALIGLGVLVGGATGTLWL
jgi:hypothetical protein